MIKNGENQSLEKLIDEIRLRDKLDSERENAPLVKAKDAIVIDTSIKTIDEQVDFIIDAIKSNMKGKKMNENSKEPVVEQALDNIESNVSDKKMVTKSPSTSKKKISPEQNTNQNNFDNIDYLSNSIFDDTKEVLIDQLLKDESESFEVIDDSRYISTFSDISEKKIISGRVIGMNEKEILVDIGFKSEGIISREEFNENALPDIGEKINVYLEKMEDESGKTVLSKEKAVFLQRWQELKDIFETQEIISGKIIKRIKGGMVVDLDGVQAFLPGSQIDVRPVKDFDKYIETEMDLKVVKFNEFRKNIVVSHKAILEESLAEQRSELFNKLKVGNIMEGRVKILQILEYLLI